MLDLLENKPFIPVEVKKRSDVLGDSVQKVYDFKNGYGASVVKGDHTYGAGLGLSELAVLYKGEICYTSGITEDVIGYLDDDGVEEFLQKIKDL